MGGQSVGARVPWRTPVEHIAGKRRSSGGRPRLPPWSERELREFRARIHKLTEMVAYSPEELDYVLGYSPRGRMTRQILGGRQPSRPYAEKFGRLEAEPPPPKPEWLPQAPKVLTGEAIPAFMVETERRECLECVALQAERQEVRQLHFFPGHPGRVVHSRCQTAWRRRRRWFRRCEELECEYLAILEGGRVPVCGSDEGCHLRRKPWHGPSVRRGSRREGQSGTRGERTELWVTRKAGVRRDQCSQDTAARLRVAVVVLQKGQQIPTT